MVTGNLDTTNLMLGIMAGVAVLEALVLIGIAVGGWLMYRRAMQFVTDLEARQIAPLRGKVDAILGDVKAITSTVTERTERVDQAISGTMDRVDETAERVKSSVKKRVNHAVGVARGVRAVVASLVGNGSRHEPPTAAAGRP